MMESFSLTSEQLDESFDDVMAAAWAFVTIGSGWAATTTQFVRRV